MRRPFPALVLAAGLLSAALVVPALAVADEPEPGAAETKPVDRLARLKQQREEAVARRDRALLKFHTYGLPQYSLEVEAATKEIERLDRELAEAEQVP